MHKVARGIYYELEGLEDEDVSDDESELNDIFDQMTEAQKKDYERFLENERLSGRQRADFPLIKKKVVKGLNNIRDLTLPK